MVIHPPLDRVSVGRVAATLDGIQAPLTAPVEADGVAWPDSIADRTQTAV